MRNSEAGAEGMRAGDRVYLFTQCPCGPGSENPTPSPHSLVAMAGLGQTEGGARGTDTRLREVGTQGQLTPCQRPARECSALCRLKGLCPSTLPPESQLPQTRGPQMGVLCSQGSGPQSAKARWGRACPGVGGRAGTNASLRQCNIVLRMGVTLDEHFTCQAWGG